MVSPGTYERICELLPKGKLKCLDVGCKDYRFEFSEYEVHRCDIVPREMPNFKVVDLNKRWDYPDESFDVIRACEVIEHLENPWHFFREAKRVLKEGGIIVFSTPNPLCPASRRLFYDTGCFHWFAPSNQEFRNMEHITPIFLWQIEMICTKLGLKVEEVRYNDEDSNSSGYQEILIVRIRKPKDV